MYNLEATPAESTSYRLAKHDKKRFGDIVTASENETPYYTNSSHLPVGYTSDIFEALDVQDARLGFSFIEFLSVCPTNWGLAPADAIKWMETNMAEYYPVKNFRTPEEMEK